MYCMVHLGDDPCRISIDGCMLDRSPPYPQGVTPFVWGAKITAHLREYPFPGAGGIHQAPSVDHVMGKTRCHLHRPVSSRNWWTHGGQENKHCKPKVFTSLSTTQGKVRIGSLPHLRYVCASPPP